MIKVVLLIILFVRLTNSQCSNLLLSLSDTNNCINGKCQYDTLLSLLIQAYSNSQTCFTFTTFDDNTDNRTYTNSILFNITTLDAFVQYELDGCYESADVDFHYNAFCSCPVDANFDNCENLGGDISPPTGTNNFLCDTVLSSAGGCYLQDQAYAIYFYWFTERNNYKICNLVNPSLLVDVLINYNNKQNMFRLNLLNKQTFDTEYYNITFYNDNFIKNTLTASIVFSRKSPDDYYIIPSANVNSETDFNPLKVGWYKVLTPNDTLVQINKQGYIATSTTQCKGNQVIATLTALNNIDIINQHDSWKGSRNAGSIFVHNISSSFYDEAQETVNIGLRKLSSGSYFYDKAGDIIPIGTDGQGLISASVLPINVNNLFTNTGDIDSGSMLCTYPDILLYTIANHSYSISVCQVDHNSTNFDEWGICVKISVHTSTDIGFQCGAGATLFPAYKFPSMQLSWWEFNCQKYPIDCFGDASNNPAVTSQKGFTLSDGYEEDNYLLYTKSTINDINALLGLKKVNVSFLNTNLIPIIKSTKTDYPYFHINIKSKTGTGNCIVYDTKQVLGSINININTTELEYTTIYYKAVFDGEDRIYVECGTCQLCSAYTDVKIYVKEENSTLLNGNNIGITNGFGNSSGNGATPPSHSRTWKWYDYLLIPIFPILYLANVWLPTSWQWFVMPTDWFLVWSIFMIAIVGIFIIIGIFYSKLFLELYSRYYVLVIIVFPIVVIYDLFKKIISLVKYLFTFGKSTFNKTKTKIIQTKDKIKAKSSPLPTTIDEINNLTNLNNRKKIPAY